MGTYYGMDMVCPPHPRSLVPNVMVLSSDGLFKVEPSGK
jgi:hypothetical protein